MYITETIEALIDNTRLSQAQRTLLYRLREEVGELERSLTDVHHYAQRLEEGIVDLQRRLEDVESTANDASYTAEEVESRLDDLAKAS